MKPKISETSKLIRKLANDKYLLYKDMNKEISAGSIIFLGDSLVQNFPINEMYNGAKRILNRGIFGSTTYDIINGLDDIFHITKPDKVIIWVGTNDFMPFVPQNTEKAIANRIIKISDLIAIKNPTTQIIVISLLPINQSSDPKIYHDWLIGKNNTKLKLFNLYFNNVTFSNILLKSLIILHCK